MFFPLGDSSILVHLGDDIDLVTNLRVHALDAQLQASPSRPAGILETVPAYATLLVHYDPLLLTCGEVVAWLKAELTQAVETAPRRARRIEVPVRYGGENGPDLSFVASYHGRTASEIVRLHAGRDYTVFMMGFTPGFPYLGRLDEALATPRLDTPRTLVPGGSVGIAGVQTGIYPMASPGGWRIIGRTSLRLFDANAAKPFLFSPGDTVRFTVESADV
jgi:KipI family sensor histidine kinase inhibitor